jgi:hypothetical protein
MPEQAGALRGFGAEGGKLEKKNNDEELRFHTDFLVLTGEA